jgi:cytochrome c oxidase assembly factor CtaG
MQERQIIYLQRILQSDWLIMLKLIVYLYLYFVGVAQLSRENFPQIVCYTRSLTEIYSFSDTSAT